MLDDKLFPELGNCMEDGMIGEDVQEEDQNGCGHGQPLSDGKEFGEKKPSLGSTSWYVGIWHYKLPKEVLWVANRDNPLSDPIGKLKVINSNLVLLDQYGTRVWWTNVTSTNLNKTPLVVELLDSGNLILRYSDNNNNSYEWQSFDFPTDT
ncbi:unnamed protein product [Brassica oleracea var. botrytis]|uniref:Bulb-type lectin domain-containing protein n=1 Tax=Brassica oleracea TaxID=3712 RepID=A0A3P6FBE9_BRAOL|nr:S-locus-specific glycoprotein S13 [Brassica napus]VDD55173.1 unnamed protein product [Brassica oleracea]